jgi:hypothetical protein
MAYIGGDSSGTADWLVRDELFDIKQLAGKVARLETQVAEMQAALKARDEAGELTYDGVGGWT